MMIDDLLQQNWSTLHSHSRDPTFRYSAKAGAGQARMRAVDSPIVSDGQCAAAPTIPDGWSASRK